MKYQIFVLISTRQQMANLPPVLSRANKNDRILWLESPESKGGNWAGASMSMLENEGIKSFRKPVKNDINEPMQVADALQAGLKEAGAFSEQCSRVLLVLNGGKKLSPIGMVLAMQELMGGEEPLLKADIEYLYGNDRPACLQVHKDDILSPITLELYEADYAPTLKQITQSRGYELNVKESKRWTWGDDLPEMSPYGVDPDYTSWLHKQWYKHSTGAKDNPKGIRFLEQWSERDKEQWNDKVFSRDMWVKNSRWNIGSYFEDVVYRRVINFLHERQDRLQYVVKECWNNVKIIDSITGKQIAELDVVLVLSNGIILHLECKTFMAEYKDLDARMTNLSRVYGYLAKMFVVAPLFGSFSKRQWFSSMHERFQKIGRWGMQGDTVIPFTMQNPPETYQVEVNGIDQTYPMSSFEDKIEGLLKPYIPPMEQV